MNARTHGSRLSWGPIGLLTAFAVLAVGMLSVDWSVAQAQETKTKAKDGKKNLENRKQKKSAPVELRATPGAGKKLDAVALAKIIDEEVDRRLKIEEIPVSGRSDDAEFLRRLSLDLIGVIPTADQVVEFLDSKDPAKRAKAIDRLLDDPRFGQLHAELWSGLMLPRESNNRRLNHTPMVKWLAAEFNKNTPLNKISFEILTASGNQDENGAVTYFVANPTVDKVTDNVSRMFLGVQLQCAQCHNHPFTDWKQQEYWGMAQFFMKVKLTTNPNQAAKKGVSPGIFETDKAGKKKGVLPESAMKVNAKFLGGKEPTLVASEPYRPVLAQWICSPENPFFARAMVNRFWHHHFGRGLVNPVDDMHDENLPSHPELLNALTEQFKSNNFDVKYLVRAICNSEAYQRTSRPTGSNSDDAVYYSHRTVRSMFPEQLYESLTLVAGRDQMAARKGKTDAVQKKGGPNGARDQFLAFFRVSEEPNVLEYEAGIPQVLRLMNSNVTNGLGGTVASTIRTVGANDPAKVVERLYLTGLSRRPSPQESERLVAFVREHPVNPIAGYTDILWSILNSSEFVLNH